MIQAPGLAGTPRAGQRLQRGDERVLDGLLGEVEVAEHADQRRDRPALLLAEEAVDDGVGVGPGSSREPAGGRPSARAGRFGRALGRYSQIGRTSIEPSLAPGILRRELDRLVEVRAPRCR